MIGVSPAYFISKFGQDFGPEQIFGSIPVLKGMGYDGFQLEITKPNNIALWDPNSLNAIKHSATANGMRITQLVAHCWIDYFNNSESLLGASFSSNDVRLMRNILDVTNCDILTIPFGAFILNNYCSIRELEDMLIGSIRMILDGIPTKVKLAFEIQPGAIIQGSAGFTRIYERIGNQRVMYNFDTGHANASKENLLLLVKRLAGRISGTHLCDNNQNENLSLCPGEGSIDWISLLEELKKNGYSGNYDIEIICRKDEVECKYKKAFEFIAGVE